MRNTLILSHQKNIPSQLASGANLYDFLTERPGYEVRKNLVGNNTLYGIIVNRGAGYETLEPLKARTLLPQSMLNWPWLCTIFCFRFARVCKLVEHNLIEGFDWLSSRKKVCFVQGQCQTYGQKHEKKEPCLNYAQPCLYIAFDGKTEDAVTITTLLPFSPTKQITIKKMKL